MGDDKIDSISKVIDELIQQFKLATESFTEFVSSMEILSECAKEFIIPKSIPPKEYASAVPKNKRSRIVYSTYIPRYKKMKYLPYQIRHH